MARGPAPRPRGESRKAKERMSWSPQQDAAISTASSVADCPTREAAQRHANRCNAEQERKARASAALGQAIENRPIPKGFYTDDDAS